MNDLNNFNDKFGALIETLTNSSDTVGSDPNEKLVSDYQHETNCDRGYAAETVKRVTDTIDLIVKNHEELKSYKEQGFTREDWFKKKIDESVEYLKEEVKTDFLDDVRNGLKSANNAMGLPATASGVKVIMPLESINAKAVVNDLIQGIRDNTFIGAISIDGGKLTIDKKNKEIKAVKEYFRSKLDSPTDTQFVKAVSTASVIAKDNGLFPKKLAGKSPEELAMIVDKGVTNAKVFYKIGSGEISLMSGIDYIVDRNVSRVGSIIVQACTNTGGKVGMKVGAFIGSVFGPAGTAFGAAIGGFIGRVGGNIVGNFIAEGAQKIGDWVKDTAKSLMDGAKNILSNVSDFFSGFFS